jgi:hypothetical protein
MGSNESVFGGSWLFAFLIIALLFGGGGGFGWGGNGNVEAAVNSAINNQTTQNGIRDVLLSSANNNYETAQLISGQNLLNAQQRSADQINVIQGFNAIQQSIAALSTQLGSCCCDIKSTLLQDKYDSAIRALAKAETEAATKAQSEYLLSVMGKWVANAPAAI